MPTIYDVIVLGTGGIGSSASWQAARRGLSVLGLDRFPPGHDRGSSHGQTRIIRQAYFEHPDYVPLLKRAYTEWAEVERQGQRRLYFQTGLLEVGPPDGVVIPGVLESARQHGLDVESLSGQQAERRWPGFRVASGHGVVFERQAGYLLVEDCVRTQLALARQLGAQLLDGVTVQGWEADGQSLTVRTDRGDFRGRRLILTAGPWAADLLGEVGVTLEVRRKHLHWYPAGPEYHLSAGCPCYFFETPAGFYYGMPQSDSRGVKVAEHLGGERVADPLHVDRSVDAAERGRVEAFTARHLPNLGREASDHAVCLYTMSPDEHFLVDVHPLDERVVFAAGLSGHGFKFATVLGQALVELAVEGGTELPVEFLRRSRLAGTEAKGDA